MTAHDKACIALAIGLAGAAPTIWSHVLEETECAEAGDFIRNAALSRDNGYLEEAFVAKMEDDIVAIQAFPPAARWVVQDDADAAMLIGAVKEVFRNPLSAEEHRSRFVAACRGTVGDAGRDGTASR
jgi:hypothetical protein